MWSNSSIKSLGSPETHNSRQRWLWLGGSEKKLPLSLQQRSWWGCYWGWRSRKLMLHWRKCLGDGREEENRLFTEFHTNKWHLWCSERMSQSCFLKGSRRNKCKVQNASEAGRKQENIWNVTSAFFLLSYCQNFNVILCVLKILLYTMWKMCVNLKSKAF